MHKISLAIYIFLILIYDCQAQNIHCGLSMQNSYQASQSANIAHQELLLNNLAYQYLQQNVGNMINGSTVEIPIVFHIIHEGGPENIADSVLINEINVLNQRYANTGNYNYTDGVNTNIQFCLASVDPYGNPTSGITRTFSSLTNMPLGGDVAVKNLVR
jgi:hypothetical protein